MENNYYSILSEMLSSMKQAGLRNKKILNVNELAQYTGFSLSYIYHLTSERAIPHFRVRGKKLFFLKKDVDSWLTSNPVPTRDQLLESCLIPLKRSKTINK